MTGRREGGRGRRRDEERMREAFCVRAYLSFAVTDGEEARWQLRDVVTRLRSRLINTRSRALERYFLPIDRKRRDQTDRSV